MIFNLFLTLLSQHELFDYKQLIDTSHYKFWGSIGLAFYFIIPSFNPAIFQRVSMAKDTAQVASSFFYSNYGQAGYFNIIFLDWHFINN